VAYRFSKGVRVRKQITRIAPLQTAKVIAILHFIVGVALAVVLMLRRAVWGFGGMRMRMGYGGGGGGGGGFHHGRFLIALPFIWAIASFIIVLFSAWVYNYLAGRTGGVEFTVDDAPTPAAGAK
jgi:hypothetical protein